MAVVYTIADKVKRDALSVTAGKLHGGVALPEQAPCLVAAINTVVIVITSVTIRDASPIGTGEGSRLAGVKRTDNCKLITAITTVIIMVTQQLLRDAVPAEAGEFGTITPCSTVHDAVLIVVGQIPVAWMGTLALSTIWTCCTNMAASTIKLIARIAALLLPVLHNTDTLRPGGKTRSHCHLT